MWIEYKQQPEKVFAQKWSCWRWWLSAGLNNNEGTTKRLFWGRMNHPERKYQRSIDVCKSKERSWSGNTIIKTWFDTARSHPACIVNSASARQSNCPAGRWVVCPPTRDWLQGATSRDSHLRCTNMTSQGALTSVWLSSLYRSTQVQIKLEDTHPQQDGSTSRETRAPQIWCVTVTHTSGAGG